MQVKLLAEGGSMKPGPALSQKLGPAGIPINNVIQQVNEATKDFKGMKVPVELEIDVNTKEIQVHVFSPPVSELIKKELEIEKASGQQAKYQFGNLSIEQVISIAKTKMPNLLANNLKKGVLSIAGSCTSLGILIESKPAKEVCQEIQEGKYDKEIQEEKTETLEEKKKELQEYFSKLKSQQDKLMKQEKDAEAAKQEKAKKKK